MARASRSPVARRTVDKKRLTRSRLKLDQRREQLLALGLTIFSERSYDEVSIDDLSRAAGVSKGLLYHYFPTKRDFYVAALQAVAQQLLDETSMIERASTHEADVRHGLKAYLGFVARRSGAYLALMRGGIGSDPKVSQLLDETRTAFLSRIFDRLPTELSGSLLRAALRGWIGFIEAMSIDWLAHRTLAIEALVEVAMAVLRAAVKGASPGRTKLGNAEKKGGSSRNRSPRRR